MCLTFDPTRTEPKFENRAVAVAVAGYFELKSTQRLFVWPFVCSDDSTVVLNVN